MKVTLESTTKIVELHSQDGVMVARVWQGATDNGVPVQAFITRIAPEISEDHPDIERVTAVFEAQLQRQATPRPSVEAIPLRMII